MMRIKKDVATVLIDDNIGYARIIEEGETIAGTVSLLQLKALEEAYPAEFQYSIYLDADLGKDRERNIRYWDSLEPSIKA